MENVTVKKVKTDATLIRKIARKRGIPMKIVETYLTYNVITPKQLALLTGETQTRILIISSPEHRERPRPFLRPLTRCFPFPEHVIMPDGKLEDSNKRGVFILRDEFCEGLIQDRNK